MSLMEALKTHFEEQFPEAAIAAKTNLITKNEGNRQTDLALRWNGMENGCLRAFALDGDTVDEMGSADGEATNVSYGYYRYLTQYYFYDYNRCGIFNGSSSKVNCGSAADIDNLAAFTVCAWIYVTAENTSQMIAAKGAGAPGWWFQVYTWSDHKGAINVTVRCATTDANKSSPFIVTKNAWHHVAMTWNDATKTVEVFYEGESKGTGTGAGDQRDESALDLLIGARPTNPASGFFKGYLADVFLYDRVLTDDEIKWLALQGDLQVRPQVGAMGEYDHYAEAQLKSASGVVEDSDGNIWVAAFAVPGVVKLTQAGEVIFRLGGTRGTGDGQLYGPWSLALDSQDNLYVTDSGNHRIQVFDKHGGFLRKWGSEGTGDGEFKTPITIAVHSNYVYVADYGNKRIQKFTLNGGFITKWGVPVPDPVFTGTGLDDMSAGHWCRETGTLNFRVEIDHGSGIGTIAEAPTAGGSGYTADDVLSVTEGTGGQVKVLTVDGSGAVLTLQTTPVAEGNDYTTGTGKATTGGTGTGCTLNISALATDTIRWSIDGGSSWEATSVAITGTNWYLAGDQLIKFDATTGHTFGDRWDWERDDLQFYSIHGIACEPGGNLWVLDHGAGGSRNFLKQFQADGTFMKKIYCWTGLGDFAAMGLAYHDGYLYCGAKTDMDPGEPHFVKYSAGDGSRVVEWCGMGNADNEVYAEWGVHVTPRETLLTTDWFGCKVQEWTLSGDFIRVIKCQPSLHENNFSVRCKNSHGSNAMPHYQTHRLSNREYTVSFYAYTDGSPVTSADIVPFASTGSTNVITEFNYRHIADGKYVCWGVFTGSVTNWKVGVEVKASKTVYVGKVRCTY